MKHYAYNSPFTMKDSEGNMYELIVERDDCTESPREWDNVATMVCWHRHYSLGDKNNYEDADDFLQDVLFTVSSSNSYAKHIYDFILSGKAYNTKIEFNDETNEWDLMGRFSEEHNWYTVSSCLGPLGDKDTPDWFLCDCITELCNSDVIQLLHESDDIALMPLYLYDHSGITMSVSHGYPYNDRWDSSCVGFIYVFKDRAMEEWGGIPEKDENGELIRIPHEHSDGRVTYSTKYRPITEENWKEVAEYRMEREVDTYDTYLRNEIYWFRLNKEVVYEEKCPHCGEVISTYTEWEEEDACGGFYGNCLEENGILDQIGDLEFVD